MQVPFPRKQCVLVVIALCQRILELGKIYWVGVLYTAKTPTIVDFVADLLQLFDTT